VQLAAITDRTILLRDGIVEGERRKETAAPAAPSAPDAAMSAAPAASQPGGSDAGVDAAPSASDEAATGDDAAEAAPSAG